MEAREARVKNWSGNTGRDGATVTKPFPLKGCLSGEASKGQPGRS